MWYVKIDEFIIYEEWTHRGLFSICGERPPTHLVDTFVTERSVELLYAIHIGSSYYDNYQYSYFVFPDQSVNRPVTVVEIG